MRWRYLFLGLALAFPTAGIVQIWPASPLYSIPGGEEREFLADDLAQNELLFLVFDPKSGEPPVIERRVARSGRLTSSTALEWRKMAELPHRRHQTLISADRAIFIWLQELSELPSSSECCRGAAFDTATGQMLGDP